MITPALLEALALPVAVEPVGGGAPADFGAPSDADRLHIKGEAKRLWDLPASKGGRSKRDFLFVIALLKGGAPEATACRLLWAMPGSKAREDKRGENYWTATIASVRRHLAEEDRLRSIALSLPDEARKRVGAAFEPGALDALLLVRDTDGPAAWQDLRAALKKAKVGLRALDEALIERRAAQPNVNVPLRYVAKDGKRVGWFRETLEGEWTVVDGSEARSVFRARGVDVDSAIDKATGEPWSLVNVPFAAEELEGRRWNKDGARLAFVPAEGPHPTWDLMLSNVGRGIDGAVAGDEWCRVGGLKTGADYLRTWLAKLVQRPKARAAYLFLHGEQESGKSTFHEALRMLFTRGYVEAGHALRSKDGFNGEIANAVVCVIEEIDLSDPKRETHERIKKWVTGDTISVRALYCQAYDLENNTHWIQCANKRSYMAVLPGDTRITEILVEKAGREGPPVSKDAFMAALLAEAPAFLWAITRMALPTPTGRLFIPALSTAGKTEQAQSSRTDLEAWLEEVAWLELTEAELVGAFLDWLPASARGGWDRRRVLTEMGAGERRDHRLVGALRALRPVATQTSDLQAMLPADVQRDWPSPLALGRALGRLKDRVRGLMAGQSKHGNTWTYASSTPQG